MNLRNIICNTAPTPFLLLLLGYSAAKNNDAHEGQLVSIPIASLASKHSPARSTYGLVQKDEEEETGYANEQTVDATDYVTNAPTLVQLSKNDKLDGTLSVVEVKKAHYAKAAKEENEEETGYGNHETVNVEDYITGAPTSLVMLKKKDDSDGTLSVV